MKKIFLFLLLLILPALTFAERITVNINPTTETDAMAFLEKLGNWLFTFAMAAVPIAILVGAFMFVTSAGNPEKVKLGRKILIWAIIGFAIVMTSKGIIAIIQGILTP